MNIIDVVQGSPEWFAVRAKHFCASEAPAMMGASKYQTRNDLLRLKATGITEDVDPAKQALYDAGHATEAAARPLVEAIIGDELYPVTATDDDDYLLASFDGVTMDGTTGFEHKLWNEDVAAQIRAGDIDPMYYWQLEQHCSVGNLERVIFVCSDGTPDRLVHMEYRPIAGRAERLLAGWQQFERDLSDYQHVEVLPAATAAPIMALPALSIQVQGSITLIDNLALFGERLTAFIAGLDKNPSTDQAFADCEAAVKMLQTAQTSLEAAEASALAQTASIDEMRRTVVLYVGQARQTRLMLEKLVKVRKDTIRIEIVQAGKGAFTEHVAGLNKRLGKEYMPTVPADFAGVIKGKRTIASLRDAVDTELARVKIESNAIADRIQINLDTLRELAKDHAFLFSDAATIVLKANDDLTALVKMRISEHAAAEATRLEREKAERKAKEEAARKTQEQPAAAQTPTTARLGQVELTGSPASAVAQKPEADLADSRPAGMRALGASLGAVSPATNNRPTRVQIIDAVAGTFGASRETAAGWLEIEFQQERVVA